MKVQKLLTLDVEIAERLVEEDNASKLVNDMLIEHYQTERPSGQSDRDRLVYLKKIVSKQKLKKKYDDEVKNIDGN